MPGVPRFTWHTRGTSGLQDHIGFLAEKMTTNFLEIILAWAQTPKPSQVMSQNYKSFASVSHHFAAISQPFRSHFAAISQRFADFASMLLRHNLARLRGGDFRVDSKLRCASPIGAENICIKALYQKAVCR